MANPVAPSGSRRTLPDLAEQRRATTDLINENPSYIALMRPPKFQKTEAGGRTRTGTPQTLPETKRYFQGIREPTRWLINRLRITETGREFHSNHVMIGPWDDNVEAGDYFDLFGERYYVLYVYPNREFQTKCEVVRYAQ